MIVLVFFYKGVVWATGRLPVQLVQMASIFFLLSNGRNEAYGTDNPFA